MDTGLRAVALAALGAHLALWWLARSRGRRHRQAAALLLLSALAIGALVLAVEPLWSPAVVAAMLLQTLAASAFVYTKLASARGAMDATNAELAPSPTETRQLADRLKTAELKAATLEATKTNFVTIAGHELQTPLAQLRGTLDILQTLNDSAALDQAQAAEYLDDLRVAEERLEALAGALLDAGQIAAGALRLNPTEVRIDDLVREVVEPLTADVRQRRLSIGVIDLNNLPPLQADPARLVQSFHNIILNAIKYTPDGGRVRITGQAIPTDAPEALLLTIEDTGVGVAEADLELIFHAFYRAHDPALHSSGAVKFMGAGPGFGLYIARGIIEAHGGAVWAESDGHDPQTSPGTTIHIRLPLAGPDAQPAAESDTSPA